MNLGKKGKRKPGISKKKGVRAMSGKRKSVPKGAADKTAANPKKPSSVRSASTNSKTSTKVSTKKKVRLTAAKTTKKKKADRILETGSGNRSSSGESQVLGEDSSSNTTNRDGKARKMAKPPQPRGRGKVAGPAASSQDPIHYLDGTDSVPKTHLNAKQLREFREILLHKRAELIGDVNNLSREALRSGENSIERSTMPIHMADLGSDNWEQEFTLGLIANEHKKLREIDDALQRIHSKTYGVCLATHKRITMGRLRAKPWAKYCIEYARLREEGRAP